MNDTTHQQRFDQQERLLSSNIRHILYTAGHPDGRLIRALDKIVHHIAAVDGLAGMELLNQVLAESTDSAAQPTYPVELPHRLTKSIDEFLSITGQEPSRTVKLALDNLCRYMVHTKATEAIRILETGFESGLSRFKASHDYKYGRDRPDDIKLTAN